MGRRVLQTLFAENCTTERRSDYLQAVYPLLGYEGIGINCSRELEILPAITDC